MNPRLGCATSARHGALQSCSPLGSGHQLLWSHVSTGQGQDHHYSSHYRPGWTLMNNSFPHQPLHLSASVSSLDTCCLGENGIFASGLNGPLSSCKLTLEMFSFSGNYFSWHTCNIQRKKSFAFLKHPIQNKRLLRLQTVCCNSLACSKNNQPHEGVCSLAIASLLGSVWLYFVPSTVSNAIEHPEWASHMHAGILGTPFQEHQHYNNWNSSQMHFFLPLCCKQSQ